MKTYKIGLLLSMSACALTAAHAQTMLIPGSSNNATQQILHESTSDTGSLLKKGLKWDSKIPLSKTYPEFSPEEKADFLTLYESMGPGDEPPFPIEGIKPIFNEVKKAQYRIKARGELNFAVSVGPDGKATKVEDYGSSTKPEMTELAGSVLLMTKFKPAVCGGKPCAMQFPFRLRLTGG
jgi:hypothetical protein